MFSAARTVVATEWKRFVRYSVGGATLGWGMGYGGGKLVMDSLLMETEEGINASIKENVWKPVQPLSRFILDQMMAKAKREGADQIAFVVGWYGLLSGVSIGIARLSLSLGFKAYTFVGWKFLGRK